MKKPKKIKYRKKPKASASLSAMENYLDHRKEVDKRNAQKQADYKKSLALKAKISKL